MFTRCLLIASLLTAVVFSQNVDAGHSLLYTDPYPGSGHDFDMTMEIDGLPVNIPGVVEASVYDELEFKIVSPEGGFSAAPFIIMVQPFTASSPDLTGLPIGHYLPIGTAQVLSDPNNPSDFGTPTFKSGGRIVTVTVPPALAGTKYMIQAFAEDPNNEDILATSRGYEVHIQE